MRNCGNLSPRRRRVKRRAEECRRPRRPRLQRFNQGKAAAADSERVADRRFPPGCGDAVRFRLVEDVWKPIASDDGADANAAGVLPVAEKRPPSRRHPEPPRAMPRRKSRLAQPWIPKGSTHEANSLRRYEMPRPKLQHSMSSDNFPFHRNAFLSLIPVVIQCDTPKIEQAD
jgi:hypothetical protein